MSKTTTPLSKDIEASNHKIKYDTQVKKVLANKIILAWILKYTVKEFAHTPIPEIETCIEGNIEIGTVPVEPGLTNYSSILGANSENAIPNEGKITFDLRFHAILPDGNQTKIIINIEAQKNINTELFKVSFFLHSLWRLYILFLQKNHSSMVNRL